MLRHPAICRCLSKRLALMAGLCLLGTLPAPAVILLDTDNALANTTAPTGMHANSGWAFQGQYGNFLGTMIAPQYFITAKHIGDQGTSFVSTAAFNGSVDVTYTIDTAANGGLGHWDIPGTDLRIVKINETFASYAQLYSGSGEVGMEMVVFGRGGPRGSEVILGTDSKGWLHTGADGVARWGANDVSGVFSSSMGSLLGATFSNVSGQQEATLSVGDSGGGLFVLDGGVWKLGGINYGVDGFFDTDNVTGDGDEFSAALFDKGGYYEGSDGTGWTLNLAGAESRLYASRISAHITEITNIVGVPEPGSVCLLAVALVLLQRRRRTE